MNSFTKQQLRDAAIYCLKALIFAVGSYLLILVIYGGSRLSFLAWSGVVLLVFTIAYIPYLVRSIRENRGP